MKNDYKIYSPISSSMRRDIVFEYSNFTYKIVELTTRIETSNSEIAEQSYEVYLFYLDEFSGKYIYINNVGGTMEKLVEEIIENE